MKVHLDFETQSRCDLIAHGTDRYVKDPSTEVTTMAYSFGDEKEIKIWFPGSPPPGDLWNHINSNGEVWAHNSSFEFQMWNSVCVPKYNFPPLRLEQTYCTMSMANAMGLMGSLDGAAQCAGLPLEKDKEGYRVMMVTCKPKADGTFWTRKEWPENFAKLDLYCRKDVEIERLLSKRLAPLSEKERKIWLLDQKINQRGFEIDVESARIFDAMIDVERERLLKEFSYLTANQVPTPASHVKFKKWLGEQGLNLKSIAKEVITKLLDEDDISPIPMSPIAKKAILIRREASKSSNAKIKMMLALEVLGRIRNGLEYYGAKQTGRWAGRKLQPHNFPRGILKFKEVTDIFKRLKNSRAAEQITILYGDVMSVASSCLRSLIVPKKGCRLIAADWANIEGRCLAWLAKEDWKLEAFRAFDRDPKNNPDIYKLTYSKAFKVALNLITDAFRQIGKVMELAFGYQGSVGSFHQMGKNYGVKVTDERAKELVDAWRNSHPKVKHLWYAIEEAAVNAINSPGTPFTVGTGPQKITYVKKGSFLCCKLPSGRIIYYPYPKYEEVDAPWGGKKMSITYMYQDAETKKWTRGPTYGGSLVENLCQAICRDILSEGLLRAEEHKYPVVLHVHDEMITEVPLNSDHSVAELERLMSVVPDWAEGFPIAAKGFESLRYRKG